MTTSRKLFPLILMVAGCGAGGGTKGGSAAGFAIVNSDFMMSTSVSLVDSGGNKLAQDDCLDSGSVSSSLSMALSSDVVLPSQTQAAADTLVLVDRTNSALDFLTPTDCKVSQQVSVATGFFSNPHDLVSISATKSYVTRYQSNATPTGANDKGTDVLIINPTTGAVSGSIDLSSYATTATGATIAAFPDRAYKVGSNVYVSLDELSADFKAAGPARVVVIDSSTDQVSGTIDLPNNKNCSAFDYLASSQTLLLGCAGDYNDPTNQAAQSGLVFIDVSGATPSVKKTVGPSALGGAPFGGGFGVVGDGLVFMISIGDFTTNAPDSLWAYSVSAGAATKVVDGDAPYVLGGISYDSAHNLAFVADASATKPVVRVFDVAAPTSITQMSTFVSNPKSGLPPRLIAAY